MYIKHFYLFFCILAFVFLNSCDKHHTKKLAGNYKCSVHIHSWDMTGYYLDSNYTEILEVKQEGKTLKILGDSFHIDSLWKEQIDTIGYIHDYTIIQFINDSIYLSHGSGGLGGSTSWFYKGKKQN